MSLTLTQYPSGRCFLNKVTEFILTSTYAVTFELTATATVFTGRYQPGLDGTIHVDVTNIVKDLLKAHVPSNGSVDAYTQADYEKEFTYKFEEDNGGSSTGTFSVINTAAVTSLSADNWLAQNFLTQQSIEKHTTSDSPEWLTYVDLVGSQRIYARLYKKVGGHSDILLKADNTTGCYTINVNYDRIFRLAPLLPENYFGYYDIIMTNSNQHEMASQRYLYKERSGREKYYLLANQQGGIDTIIADGEKVMTPEIGFNFGEFSKQYVPLDDTAILRKWKQSLTMEWRERNWLFGVIAAKGEAAWYNTQAKKYEKIVIAGADLNLSDANRLASSSFSFIMADASEIVVAAEEQSRSYSQSAADDTEPLDDDSTQVVLAFDNTGYTEVVTLPTTKVYVSVIYDPSLPSSNRDISVYKNDTLVGTYGLTDFPKSFSKAVGDTMNFYTGRPEIHEVILNYYPSEIN